MQQCRVHLLSLCGLELWAWWIVPCHSPMMLLCPSHAKSKPCKQVGVLNFDGRAPTLTNRYQLHRNIFIHSIDLSHPITRIYRFLYYIIQPLDRAEQSDICFNRVVSRFATPKPKPPAPHQKSKLSCDEGLVQDIKDMVKCRCRAL